MNDVLTVGGAILGLVGLGFVFAELAVTRSLEFGVPTPWARVATWIRRVLGRPRVVEAEVRFSLGGAMTAQGKVRPEHPAEGATLAETVVWLRDYVMRVDSDLDKVPDLIDNKAARTLQQAKEHADGVRRQIEEREEQRRAALRRSIRRQAAGAVCVLLGTIAGTAGALWPADAPAARPKSEIKTVVVVSPTILVPAGVRNSTSTAKPNTGAKKHAKHRSKKSSGPRR